MKVHNYLRSRTKRSKKPQIEIIKLVLRIYNVNNYIVIVEKMAHYNVQSSTRVTIDQSCQKRVTGPTTDSGKKTTFISLIISGIIIPLTPA